VKYMLFSLLVMVVACNRATETSQGTPSAEMPAPASKSPDSSEGSVGTVGGGGTLVFTFKNASTDAADTLEKIGRGNYEFIDDYRVLTFFQRHQPKWLEALRSFSEDSEKVVETKEVLKEHGKPVGALSYPPESPEKVLLSIPYLTTHAGFPYDKAFILAMHEAAHFAIPVMSEEEHRYLDQISHLVLKARNANRINSLTLFKAADTATTSAPFTRIYLPNDLEGKRLIHGLTRDGAILYVINQKGDEHYILTYNLRSGEVYRETISPPWSFRWLGRDRFALARGKTIVFRDLGTQEKREFTLENDISANSEVWMDPATAKVFTLQAGKKGQKVLWTSEGVVELPRLAASRKVEAKEPLEDKTPLGALNRLVMNDAYRNGVLEPEMVSNDGKYVFEQDVLDLVLYSLENGKQITRLAKTKLLTDKRTELFDGSEYVWVRQEPERYKTQLGRLHYPSGKVDWIYDGWNLDGTFLDEARLKQPSFAGSNEWSTSATIAVRDFTPGAKEARRQFWFRPLLAPNWSRDEWQYPSKFLNFAGSEQSVAMLVNYYSHRKEPHSYYTLQWVDFANYESGGYRTRAFHFQEGMTPVSFEGVHTKEGNIAIVELTDGSFLGVLFR